MDCQHEATTHWFGGIFLCNKCGQSVVTRGGLPWDDPNSNPIEDIRNHLNKQRETNYWNPWQTEEEYVRNRGKYGIL